MDIDFILFYGTENEITQRSLRLEAKSLCASLYHHP